MGVPLFLKRVREIFTIRQIIHFGLLLSLKAMFYFLLIIIFMSGLGIYLSYWFEFFWMELFPVGIFSFKTFYCFSLGNKFIRPWKSAPFVYSLFLQKTIFQWMRFSFTSFGVRSLKFFFPFPKVIFLRLIKIQFINQYELSQRFLLFINNFLLIFLLSCLFYLRFGGAGNFA